MPLGESVGTAYVRIIADGEGLDESIRKQFDDADPSFEEAGRRSTKAYAKGWEEEWNKQPNQKKLTDGIRNTLLKGDFLQSSFFRDRAWTRFKSGMANTFGEAGKLATLRLEQELLRGETSLEQLGDRVNNMLGDVARAQTELFNETQRMERERLDEAYRMNADFNRRVAALNADREATFERQHDAWMAMLREAYQTNRDFDAALSRQRKDSDAEFEASMKVRVSLVRQLENTYEDILKDTARLARGERTLFGSKSELIEALIQYRRETRAAGAATDEWEVEVDQLDQRLRLLTPRLTRVQSGIGRLADRMGALTGRGARNDAVNFFGSLTRGAVNLLQVLPRVIGFFARFINIGKAAFDRSIAAGAGGLMSAVKGVSASLFAAVVAFTAVAAAAVIFAAVVGPLTALLMALVGAITAVVGSLMFGLLAALVAVGGALVPLVAGIGVTIAAFQSLDKEAKKALEQDFKPVTDAFKALGDVAAGELFKDMSRQADILAGVVGRLEPIVQGVARAIRNVFDGFVDGLNSPFFRQFMEHMETFIPGAVARIGIAFSNFFFGFLGFFQAASPLITRFLDWLVKISEQFMNWATSKEGRREIREFLRDAGDSAAALGQFLSDAAHFLGALFTAGQDTGDSLITTLGDKLREWGDFIKENPDAVSKFFRDAEKLVTDLGRVAEAAGKVIDALDNPKSRAIASGVLQGISTALKLVARFAEAATAPIIILVEGFRRVRNAVETAGNWVGQRFPNSLGEARNAARRVVDAIQGFFAALPGRLAAALASVGEAIRGPFDRALLAIRSMPQAIVNYFAGLGARISAAIGRINWPEPPSWLKAMGGLGGLTLASGGVISGPVHALVGEAGPEAVVPLNRPLSMVDPSVRWLSAIAQGKDMPRMASGGVAGGRSIDASGWQIMLPTGDPQAAAATVVNRLAALGS